MTHLRRVHGHRMSSSIQGDVPATELDLLRSEATASPAWDWILQVLRHIAMAELPLSPALFRHAITVGEGRFGAGEPIEPQPVELRTERTGLVYYMRMGSLVKIGTSTNLAARCRSLNPEEVLTVESGGYPLEQRRHGEFSALRVHGEWFRLEDPLVPYIQLLQARFLDSFGMDFAQWKRAQDLPTRLL